MSNLNILYESSLGFGLFELVKADEVGLTTLAVQKALVDLGKFSKIVKLKSMFISRAVTNKHVTNAVNWSNSAWIEIPRHGCVIQH